MAEPEPYHQCCGHILLRTNFHRTRQCSRAGVTEIGGRWYCGQHNPTKEKKERKRPLRLTLLVTTLKRLTRSEKGLINKINGASKDNSGLYLEPESVVQLRDVLREVGISTQTDLDSIELNQPTQD